MMLMCACVPWLPSCCRRLLKCLLQRACWVISSQLSGLQQGAKPPRSAPLQLGCCCCGGSVGRCLCPPVQAVYTQDTITNWALPPCPQAPPSDRKYRAALATAIEPCRASFRHLIAAALTSESRLLRAAVVRVLARASGGVGSRVGRCVGHQHSRWRAPLQCFVFSA